LDEGIPDPGLKDRVIGTFGGRVALEKVLSQTDAEGGASK